MDSNPPNPGSESKTDQKPSGPPKTYSRSIPSHPMITSYVRVPAPNSWIGQIAEVYHNGTILVLGPVVGQQRVCDMSKVKRVKVKRDQYGIPIKGTDGKLQFIE